MNTVSYKRVSYEPKCVYIKPNFSGRFIFKSVNFREEFWYEGSQNTTRHGPAQVIVLHGNDGIPRNEMELDEIEKRGKCKTRNLLNGKWLNQRDKICITRNFNVYYGIYIYTLYCLIMLFQRLNGMHFI